MNRRRLTAWIVGGVIVLSGAVVSAIVLLPSGGGGDGGAPPVYHSGEVVTVDAAANRITLREGLGHRSRDVKIHVDSRTKIVHAGQPMALDDVRAGDHATIRVRLPSPADAREPTAQEIHVASAGDPADTPTGDDDDSGN